MSTNSTIAIELEDGRIEQVYCHWDGYIEYVGRVLFDSYSDPEKLRELISHGDISSLTSEIGVKHPFSSSECGVDEWKPEYEEMTTFYGRDRGEQVVSSRHFTSYNEYIEHFNPEEYNYLLSDNVWFVNIHKEGTKWVPLLTEIEKLHGIESPGFCDNPEDDK